MSDDDQVDQVLVRRVLRLYNPWEHLQIPSEGFATTMLEYLTQETYLDGYQRTDDYHYGRVRFLMKVLLEGKPLEPIELDNRWVGTSPAGLLVIDGHHRLIAAALLKVPTIPASYSGWTEILSYLKGERKTSPVDRS